MSEIFQLYECGDVFQFTDPADSYQTWQGLRGPKGDPGEPGPPGAGVQLRGPVPSTSDLPATAPSGELWQVGVASPYHGWFYNGTNWEDAGEITVGPQGPPGAAAGFGTPTISVGSGTGTPSATVTASGPDTAKVFAFTFENLKGAQGDPGAAGQDGADGAAATIAVGTVSGLPAGSTPTVTNSGTSAAAVFNFGIPAGAQGAPGQDGDDGAAAGFGTPTASVGGNVGTPGVTITASGPDTAKVFDFAFTNLKGETGATGQGVPTGGTAGQVLGKASGTDYDTTWVTKSTLPSKVIVITSGRPAIHVPNGCRTFIVATDSNLNYCGIYIIVSYSGGFTSVLQVSSSGRTVTGGQNKATFDLESNKSLELMVFCTNETNLAGIYTI